MRFEGDVEQGELRVVVSHVQFLEVYRASGALRLELLLDLLALGVVPVPKVNVCAKAVIQRYSSCPYTLCPSCRSLH